MRKNRIRIVITCMTAVILGLVGVSQQAFADNIDYVNGLIVSPTNENLILSPGEVTHGTIQVSNGSNATEPYKYKVSVGPFSSIPDNTDYQLDTTSVTNYNQIVDWIRIEKTEGYVNPNETIHVPYTITVPKNAPGGGQYAVIRVQRVNESENKNGLGIMENVEIGCLIYATVTGETNIDGTISENSIPSFLLEPPIIANTLITNTGNVHQTARYALQVFPLFSDEEIYTNIEDPKEAVIIPGQSYAHRTTWDNTPPVGIFKVIQTVEFAGQTSVTEKMVIICPIWLLFIIIFAIIALIIWLVIRSKNRKKATK